MKKIIILTVALILLVSNACFATWVSSDPNDLKPIMGTVWEFYNSYEHIILYFYNYYEQQTAINIFNMELIDAWVVKTSTDSEWLGTTQYDDISGKKEFVCNLFNSSPEFENEAKFYYFQIDGNNATGTFYYYNELSPDNLQTSPLVGTKKIDLLSDQNQHQPTPAKALNSESSSGSDNGMGCFIQSLIVRQSGLCP